MHRPRLILAGVLALAVIAPPAGAATRPDVARCLAASGATTHQYRSIELDAAWRGGDSVEAWRAASPAAARSMYAQARRLAVAFGKSRSLTQTGGLWVWTWATKPSVQHAAAVSRCAVR